MPNRSSTYSGTGSTLLLTPAARTADAVSTGLDTRDSDDVTIQFIVGTAADTLSGSTYIELELEESDDNSAWNDVANADITNYTAGSNVGTSQKLVANASAGQTYLVGYKGYKRYVRGVVNVTGTHTNGTIIGVAGLKRRNRLAPVNATT